MFVDCNLLGFVSVPVNVWMVLHDRSGLREALRNVSGGGMN